MWFGKRGDTWSGFSYCNPVDFLIRGWQDNNQTCVGRMNTLGVSHSGSFQPNRVVESVVKGIDKFDGVSTLHRPGSAWPCNHVGTTERHRPQYFHQNAATALFVFHFDTERWQILSARGAKTRTRATALITTLKIVLGRVQRLSIQFIWHLSMLRNVQMYCTEDFIS